MKKIIILGFVVFMSQAFSQERLKMREFNKILQDDIDQVLQNNPQIYEKAPIKNGRKPASLAPVEKAQEHERYQEKYDKNLGLKDW